MANTQTTYNQEDFVSQYSRQGTLILAGLVLLVCVYFFSIAVNQTLSGINYIITAFLLLTTAMTAAGLTFAIRKNQETGLKLTLYALAILGITVSILSVGRTLSASISILTVSIIAIEWLLPARARKQQLTFTAVIFILMWVIEFIDPPWRISIGAAVVGPYSTIIFAILLGLTAFRHSRKAIAASLRLQITVVTGSIIAILAIILLIYSVLSNRLAAIDAAEKEALAVSQANAQLVHDRLNTPLVTARALADSFEGIKDPQNPLRLSRAQVNAMLKKIAEENPDFLATYTLWEPNAFDGFDALHVGETGHDETGRFIPYWVKRADGTITVEPLIDYETPGLGDWYLIPRQTGQEYTVAPLVYPIAGVDTLMASFIVPIIVDDTFYGIAGVDAPITFVQSIVDDVNLYNNQAEAVLLTDTGTLIAVHQSPEFTNQPAEQLFPDFAELQPRIKNGESFVSLSPDGRFLRVFSPIDISEVGTHWSFSLIIPFSVITLDATKSALLEGSIGFTLTVITFFILWYLTGQIVRPILDLTSVAEKVTQGDLNASAEVRSQNETGILENAFNLMTTQLRGMVVGLEKRVADRTRNLELAAEVGRAVSQVRALDAMLTDAAELIREQFNLYYVQVYLINPSQTYLILQSGTGEVGRELLSRNHRLPLTANSLNGRAATEKKPVIIADTLKSATFKPNSLLPMTRSEMSIPLMIGDKVVGVLDMQSDKKDALNKDVLPAFEALAGQLAIAIQNAYFLAETQQARAEVEAQAQKLARTNWTTYLDAIHKPEHTGFIYENDKVEPLTHFENQHTADTSSICVPIEVAGEQIGSLVVEQSEDQVSSRNSQLTEVVAHQVAQRVESLRLLESAERYRIESEQAARRLTREGWQDYLLSKQDKSLGYLYDLKEVKPVDNAINILPSAQNLPIKVGEEAIGSLAIDGMAADDAESLELVHAVVERLGQHIEGLRLLETTEESRSKLQVNEARLAEALQIARLGNWEYDVEKDLFTFNDQFYLIFHTTAEEVGGYQISSAQYAQKFVHPDDIAIVGNEIGKALNSTERLYTASIEHRFLYADGGMGYIAVSVNVERDENGKITRFYGANQDVTERKLAEDRIRTNEARMRTLVENAPEAIVVFDGITGLFGDPNENALKMFKFSKEELAKYTPGDLSPKFQPDGRLSAESAKEKIEDALNGGTPVFEWVHLDSTGHEFPCEIRLVLLPGGGDHPQVRVSITDITERKQAELRLETERSLLTTLIENLPENVFIKDTSGRIVINNKAHRHTLGAEKLEDVLGKTDYDFFPQELAATYYTDEQKIMQSGKPLISHEEPVIDQDGNYRWLLTTKVPIRDNQGNVTGIVGVNYDITERKLAENLIAERANQLETVATVSTTASTVLNPDALLQTVVDLTKERFSLYHAHIYLSDESWNTLLLSAGAGEVGRKMVATGHAIQLDAKRSLVARAAREKQPVIVNDIHTDVGFLANVLLPETHAEMAVPMIVGNNVLGVFDVQSEKSGFFSEEDALIYTTLAAQVAVALQNARLYQEQAATLTQLRELDKLKSSFLANMSHELRTPLNSILGFTDVMLEGLDGSLTPYMNNDLRLIQKNGQHLLHLINDVLDMAKIESGRMNLHPEKFKVHSILDEVISITSTLASERNLALYIDPESDTDVEIYADNTRLRQVMINLVNNSIKFTEQGNIAVKVNSIDSSRVLITVKDTGLGIPPEKAEAIFQEFTQVDNSTTRKAGGTGLGLPISRRLVQMHGGKLWAESSGIAGEGSTFFVEMPTEARITEIIEKKER